MTSSLPTPSNSCTPSTDASLPKALLAGLRARHLIHGGEDFQLVERKL